MVFVIILMEVGVSIGMAVQIDCSTVAADPITGDYVDAFETKSSRSR